MPRELLARGRLRSRCLGRAVGPGALATWATDSDTGLLAPGAEAALELLAAVYELGLLLRKTRFGSKN